MNNKIAYSCYVDNQRKFQVQSLRFIYSLNKIGVDASDIYITANSECPKEYFSALSDKLKVSVTIRDNFTNISKPANKWLQIDSQFPEQYTHLILNDCDKYYYSFNSNWADDSIRACKFVPRPTFTIFEKIFKHYNFNPPRFYLDNPDPRSELKDKRNYVNNHNGGMLIIPIGKLNKLTERWKYYIDNLLDNISLLEDCVRNLDQVAFACAMEDLGSDINHLPKSLDIALGVQNIEYYLNDYIKHGQLILHIHADEDEFGMIKHRSTTDKKLVELVNRINLDYKKWIIDSDLEEYIFNI